MPHDKVREYMATTDDWYLNRTTVICSCGHVTDGAGWTTHLRTVKNDWRYDPMFV